MLRYFMGYPNYNGQLTVPEQHKIDSSSILKIMGNMQKNTVKSIDQYLIKYNLKCYKKDWRLIVC